ncbi:Outer membrane protein P6 [Andreprevotia sp. IGB-42]|uniref:peptidoglycan-associated lipoprotein Pal n=1 Tax=Andreprevotia sp. IGB-42 TaxID=2497473 RepID=UPI00135A5DCB|nr:peptidoglycan-associated lipoprotein Pal [Andreprevotia sp. IGB-42]KAF0812384.1 Outer membrane protein P6 [Andreprevotia sp. IGB-42]
MKKLAASLLMTALLAACASQQTTQPPVAPITDKTGTDTSATTNPATVDLTKGSTTDAKGYNVLTDPNNILSSRRIYFDYDSYSVKPEFNDVVEAHSKYLNEHKEAKLIVQGNTDNRGTAEYNLALGQKRADAVKKQMNALGVNDSQLETVSFGKEKPLEGADTEEAWARNRRAELVYDGEAAK